MLYEELLAQIDYMQVLTGLNPRDRGDKIVCICPKCQDKEAYIFKDGRAIICRKENKCGQATTLFELVGCDRTPRGKDFVDGCHKLAQAGGTTFESGYLTPDKREEIEQKNNRRTALEIFRDWTREQFAGRLTGFSEHVAKSFLENRSFDTGALVDWGFGLLEDVSKLEQILSLEQLVSLGFKNERGQWKSSWNERILIPLRDRHGRLHGYSGRAYGDIEPKYINTLGTSLKDIVATELNHVLQHGDTLIAVEGYLDPYKARQYGENRVGGVGSTGKSLSVERWEKLYDYGIKQVVMVLDSDKAGAEGLDAALHNRDKAKRKPSAFVVCIEGAKDLDSWLDLRGRPTISELLKTQVHCDRFRARLIQGSRDVRLEAERWRFIEDCLHYDQQITDPAHIISLTQHFWPEVESIVGDMSVVVQVRDELRNKKQSEQKRKAIEKYIQDLQLCVKKSPDEAMTKILTTDFSGHNLQSYSSPVLPADELILQDSHWLSDLSSREFLGTPQCKLPSLDVMLSGLHGLILVAGRTNIGKTIFLGQTAIESVLKNPDACCLFVSLEMHPRRIRTRLLSYLSDMTYKQIIAAHKPDMPIDMVVARAKRRLGDAMKRIAFVHPEEPHGFNASTRTIVSEIANLKARTGCKTCIVIIDFLGIWPVDESLYKTDIQQQKRQIEDMIYIRDANNGDAVLSVVEVRKADPLKLISEDDVMGSARQTYRADSLVVINRFNQRLATSWYEISPEWNQIKPCREEKNRGKQDTDNEYKFFQKWCQTNVLCPLQFDVVKVRDGGSKGQFNALVHWSKNRIDEGLEHEDSH